jgi:hypothetical protein
MGDLYRVWRRDVSVGSYDRLPEYIRQHVGGRSFVDIGCMWGVNGAYAFAAEESGATRVVGVDVFGPTPEFEDERARRGSAVRFVLGDATDPRTIAEVGEVDVVFCAGVLYHHPSPYDLLVALRRMCRTLLILRTSTIPEVPGLRGAAVYWPMLDARSRRMWDLTGLGLSGQLGITTPFDPAEGYGNWFWGMSPSCVQALLETAGFRVTHRATEAFAQTFFAEPVDEPLAHVLPGEQQARQMGTAISREGVARPH